MDQAVCVVLRGPGEPSSWVGEMSGAPDIAVADSSSASDSVALRAADCGLIDAAGAEAVELARRAYEVDPSLQVAIVAPSEERAATERAVLFSPGLGEVWIVSPQEVGADLVTRASEVTRQRRAYRSTHTRIEHDLATIEPHVTRRALISDAYLASLLSVLPDPVLSIDSDGKVLSWNTAAEDILGYSRADAVGRSLAEVLGTGDPLLGSAWESGQARQEEIRFRRRGGEEGIGEMWVVPVEAGGHSVRAVVLHNVTEERRAQAELEEQAGELEAQATELEASQLELEMSNADLQRVNEEVERAARRAQEARDEAEAVNRRLEAVLHQMPSGVVLAEAPSGTIVLGNEQVERIWRAPFLAEGSDGYEGFRGYFPDGRRYQKQDWPLFRSVAGELVMDEEIDILRGDGTRGVISVSSTPIESASGEIVAAVAIFDDITERRTREEQQTFLSEAGATLSASLEYEETLQAIARLAVPKIADWCAVDVLEDGVIRRLAAVHSDPAKEELAHEVARRWPTDPGSNRGVSGVLKTGRAELVEDISEEVLTAASQSDEHLRLLRALGLRSALIVPLVARGRTFGAITLIEAESGRRYGPEDMVFAEQLAARAALAVDNARLFRAAQLARDAAEKARTEAEEASRAKSEFLANMSHEIRTPINAIMGYTDLLHMGLAGPVTEQQSAQLERVRVSSRHLLGLIEDILDLAKVEAGRMDVAHDRARAVEAVSEAISLVAPQAAAKDVVLVNDCAAAGEAAYVGDEDRVRQIVVNLLSNSVKFTDPGGEVRITCGSADAEDAPVAAEARRPLTFIRVTDTGIGIAEDQIEDVFRPFEQVEKGRTRIRGGTGLGLTISRHLARLMGGDLTVRSELGVGSEFTLWLQAESPGRYPTGAAGPPDVNRTPGALAAAGRALAAELGVVLQGYLERVRTDPDIPEAGSAAIVELEAHASTLLSHIANHLIAMGDPDGIPVDLLDDGEQIRRVISELHGAQRARLGWTAAGIEREFSILRAEISASITRRMIRREDSEKALEVLSELLEQARATSVETLRSTHRQRA